MNEPHDPARVPPPPGTDLPGPESSVSPASPSTTPAGDTDPAPARPPPPRSGRAGPTPGDDEGETQGRSGQDWRDAVRRAQADNAKQARNRRVRPRRNTGVRYIPGGNRRSGGAA